MHLHLIIGFSPSPWIMSGYCCALPVCSLGDSWECLLKPTFLEQWGQSCLIPQHKEPLCRDSHPHLLPHRKPLTRQCCKISVKVGWHISLARKWPGLFQSYHISLCLIFPFVAGPAGVQEGETGSVSVDHLFRCPGHHHSQGSPGAKTVLQRVSTWPPPDWTQFRRKIIVTGEGVIGREENYRAALLHPWGICSKTPSGCLKPGIVPNPIYTLFFPIHTPPIIKFNL